MFQNLSGSSGGSGPPGVQMATMMLAACATVLIMPDLDAWTSAWVYARASLHYGPEMGTVVRYAFAACLTLLVWAVLRSGFWIAGMALASSAFAKFVL
ncbi:MAG: hypothetical protein AAFR02_00110 [Pseudomonadota bacterium]